MIQTKAHRFLQEALKQTPKGIVGTKHFEKCKKKKTYVMHKFWGKCFRVKKFKFNSFQRPLNKKFPGLIEIHGFKMLAAVK